jgi:hypothetical protein
MMRTYAVSVVFYLLTSMTINTALAADAPDKPSDPQDCVSLAATPATGTATDRFMREWCQRNVPTATPAPAAAPHPQPTLQTPTPPEVAPRYSNDDSADQLNSSRLPPGYHCHMLKFGERICHGGLD